MGFLRVLKAIGGVAVALPGPAQPVIIAIESAVAASRKTPTKREEILVALKLSEPLIVQLLEDAAGAKLSDPELFEASIDHLVQGIVGLIASFQGPKPAKTKAA